MQFCSLPATGFLPIIAWTHTFSSIYSSCCSQKLGFIAELSQKAPAKGAAISISSSVSDGGPSSASADLPKQHPHPWCQSRLSPSRLCLARSQYYISLSHAAESHKLLPSCSMSRTGLVEKKEMVFTAQLRHLEQMVD